MTPRRFPRRIFIIASLILLAVGPLAVTEAATAENLVIQSVDTSGYPAVDLQVVLPAELAAGGALSAENFSVTENGESVPLTVKTIVTSREPIAVVLAIDTSGSMKGKPLLNAKQAANNFVKFTKDTDEIAIVSFSSKPTVAAGFAADKNQVALAIAGLEASGETALYDALVTAVNLAKNNERGQKNIVLLSDGGDTQSINKLDTAVNSLGSSGIPAYVVALSSPEADPKTLQLLAQESNGKFIEVSDSAKLSQLFGQIAQEIQTRFLVTFESAEPSTKDIVVDVEASVGASKAAVSTVVKNPVFRKVTETQVTDTGASGASGSGASWLLLTVVLSFGAATLLTLAVVRIMQPDADMLKRLKFYDQIHEVTDGSQREQADSVLKERMMEAIGVAANKRGLTEVVHHKLEAAGLPLRPVEYMFFHILAVVALSVVTILLSQSIAVTIVLVVFATALPLLLLETLISRRQNAFQEQLPDVLNFMAGSLRAGHGLLQALTLVEQETGPPVSVEFRRVQNEVQLGLPLEKALAKMADRIGSDDFQWAVAAISIQRESGGNLAELLDTVAKTIRDRETLRRHIRGLSAEGRLSAAILIILPFAEAIFLFLVNPLYMSQLFSATFGIVLVSVGLLLVIAGAFWLRRVVMIEV